MKHDSKSFVSAEVDVANARFSKVSDMGISFTNEIDVWSQMEFRARQQINHLKLFGTLSKHVVLSDLNSYFYSTRQTLEEI